MPTDVTEQVAIITGLRPRCESANIRTWIGFKQFMSLAQEAVLGWFRQRGYGPQRLFHEHGLGLRVVDSSVLLPAVLEVDDEVTAEVSRVGTDQFAVRLSVGQGPQRSRVLRGRVHVELVAAAPDVWAELPEDLRSLVATSAAAPAPAPAPAAEVFAWDWQARYIHCHYSDRVQHLTWVQAMEEVVDRFLQHRGLGVPQLLAERGWIPVVSRARVTILADARMDDIVRTTFAVHDIVAGRAFDGSMDCYVVDGDHVRRVATGTILHGYAISRGPDAGRLAELDATTADALLGRVSR